MEWLLREWSCIHLPNVFSSSSPSRSSPRQTNIFHLIDAHNNYDLACHRVTAIWFLPIEIKMQTKAKLCSPCCVQVFGREFLTNFQGKCRKIVPNFYFRIFPEEWNQIEMVSVRWHRWKFLTVNRIGKLRVMRAYILRWLFPRDQTNDCVD